MNKKIHSGIMLTLLLVGMLTLALAFNIQQAKASGPIYIRADGSIDPPTANVTTVDNVTYTFTDNNYDEIVVERSNIIVDGKGYALRGAGSGYGFELRDLENVTIRNTSISNFYSGIDLYHAYCCTLSGNNITATERYGIQLRVSSNNNISENNIVGNDDTGLHLFQSGNNVLINNNMTGNKHNFDVYGAYIPGFSNDIDTSNTVNGKPIYYWINKQDMSAPLDAGYLALIDCENITVKNLNIESNGQGILLAFTSNSTITRNNLTSNFHGIWLRSSTHNFIFKNNIAYNNYDGIHLLRSSNNTVFENNITNNTYGGVAIESYSSSNRIRENNIVNSENGITIRDHSNHNHISGNHMADHNTGIKLIYSANNTLSGNNIISNRFCFLIWESSNNSIYHNNFMDNTEQGLSLNSISIWDGGYPSGGNYWSDYMERHPEAKELGDSGIWDTPYFIDETNQDNYPLMEPWTSWDGLKAEIEEMGSDGEIDNHGIVKSLLAKLNVAQKLVDEGKIDEAKSILEEDFIPQVQNLANIHITQEAADTLIESAEYILSNL